MTFLLLSAFAPGGCKDEDGDGNPEPASNDTDFAGIAEGTDCTFDEVGFERECVFETLEFNTSQETIAKLNALGDQPAFLDEIFPGAGGCCGGCAPQAVADAQCESQCLELACDAARAQHVAMFPFSCEPNGDEGFDIAGCRTGAPTTHEFDCAFHCFGFGICGDQYVLDINCDANQNNVYDSNTGCLATLNDPEPNVVLCGGSDGLVKPGSVGSTDFAQESAGSYARVVWSTPATSGIESTTDLDLDFAYAVGPCDSKTGECLTMTQLDVRTSDLTIGGFPVSRLRLALTGSDAAPAVDRSGNFTFPAGTLHFSVEYRVLGLPNQLVGTNESAVTGQILPLANQLSLSDLQLRHTDAIIDATLYLTLAGDYVARSPIARIRVLDDPRDCAEPVVFDAASVDADGDPLTHHWEVPGLYVGVGDSLSVALPSGRTQVILNSHDGTRSDVATITHHRQCD